MFDRFLKRHRSRAQERSREEDRRDRELGEEALRGHEIAVLFKHSPSCPVSWAAHREVESFRARHPSVPVHTISVLAERALSRRIAAWTGVRHESPQVIVLRHGQAVNAASHEQVTAEYLSRACSGACSEMQSRG
jgi:bacillithiol system protein YtxJ